MIRINTLALCSILCASAASLGACGDASGYSLDPGRIDWDTVETRAGFDGAEVELMRYSSECARASAKSLRAEVGEGTEFEADAVGALGAPCSEGPTPSVNVQIEQSRLTFDFSSVASAGRFSSAEFDGFVMTVSPRRHNGLLIAATLDRRRTTLPLEQEDIYFERDYIEVNFESVSYDREGRVEIELRFANLDPLSGDTD